MANAIYQARDERRHNRLGRLSLTLEHDLGGGASVSGMLFGGPKFLQRSERGTFRDFTRYHVGGNAIFRGRHSLVAGARVSTPGAPAFRPPDREPGWRRPAAHAHRRCRVRRWRAACGSA